MIIQTFASGPLATNTYTVTCEKTGDTAIIDPAPDSFDSVISYLNKQKLDAKIIILTHSHWDHIADVARFKKQLNIPVVIHSLDAENLKNPGSDRLPTFIEIKGVEPDEMIENGQKIVIGSLTATVIHTPGHTPGGVCLYFEDDAVLISGDTLFKGSFGNVSFPMSNPDDMWASLATLSKLDPSTTVYPGHGPSTTIGKESWLAKAKEYFNP